MNWIDKLRPKWKNSDWHIRKAAVEGLKDEQTLSYISRTDKNVNVRRAAVGRLTNLQILFEIAIKDADDSVALTAIRRLDDESNSWFLPLHLNRSIPLKRRAYLIHNISNQRILVSTVKKNLYDLPDVSNFRKEILAQISDTYELYALIISFKSEKDLKLIAKEICEVKDDYVIFDVIMHSANSLEYMPDILIETIQDQSVLLNIVRGGKLNTRYRLSAIDRINDLCTLRDIAINPGEEHRWTAENLSRKAAKTLSDIHNPEAITMLVEVIKKCPYMDTVLEAITGLQTCKELPSSFRIISKDMLLRLKNWLKDTNQYSLEGDIDDAKGEHYEENRLYIRIGQAISWLEKEINQSKE